MSIGDLPPLPELPSLSEVIRSVKKHDESVLYRNERSVLDKSEVIIVLNKILVPLIERINPNLRPYEMLMSMDVVHYSSTLHRSLPTIQTLESRYPNARLNFFQVTYTPKARNDEPMWFERYFSSIYKDIINKSLHFTDNLGDLETHSRLIKNGIGIGD